MLRHAEIGSNCIASLRGIEQHAQLESLRLENNCLRSLDGIQSLAHLASLSAARNLIADASAVAKLPLATLDLSRNFLTAPPELPPTVATLRLGHNRLTSAPDAAALPALSHAELQHNNISDVDALRAALGGGASLRVLELSANPVASSVADFRIEVISLLPALTQLDNDPVSAMEKVPRSRRDTRGGDSRGRGAAPMSARWPPTTCTPLTPPTSWRSERSTSRTRNPRLSGSGSTKRSTRRRAQRASNFE